MKKLLSILLLLLSLALSFSACNEEPGDSDDKDKTEDENNGNEGGENNKGEEKVTFIITWVDEKGVTIKTTSVTEGDIPAYQYTVTDTAEWDHTFEGWATTQNGEVLPAIPQATENSTYYAKVSSVKQKYTVTFNTTGGSLIASQTVEYGEVASIPENPSYEGHRFVGWSSSSTDTVQVNFEQPITGNVEYFAVWNEVIDAKALLQTLLNGYKLNPLGFIPEAMLADYSANLVNGGEIINDYSDFVNVSDVTYGFGEQWHMVLDNLEETQTFFNALSVVDTLSAASITAFNNYFDDNPADTAHHQFKSGIYNVAIDFDGELIVYVLDYTVTLPIVGEQTAQIALAMKIESGERSVRVQLGDANALTYTMLGDSYEFAIKYGGVRRAMFSVARDENGNVSGKIYEYLTVSSAEIASAADFYITDEYVSVVGNKASGMVGFTGYITELYDTESGRLIGYEVQETLSSIVYNTLWFNLSDVDGINTIKYQPAEGSTAAKIYINGSKDIWGVKKVGGLSLKALSRRFDIEFRTQYVYSYDAQSGKYIEHAVQVPMLFVQEENYDTLISDVKSANKITVSIDVNGTDFEQMLSDYDTLIPIFIQHKDLITPEIIIAYIGEKITFQDEE